MRNFFNERYTFHKKRLPVYLRISVDFLIVFIFINLFSIGINIDTILIFSIWILISYLCNKYIHSSKDFIKDLKIILNSYLLFVVSILLFDLITKEIFNLPIILLIYSLSSIFFLLFLRILKKFTQRNENVLEYYFIGPNKCFINTKNILQEYGKNINLIHIKDIDLFDKNNSLKNKSFFLKKNKKSPNKINFSKNYISEIEFFEETLEALPIDSIENFDEVFMKKSKYDILKKLFDFLFAIFLLIILLPIFLIISIIIRIDSKGPIFYTQTRTGYNKKCFSIIKFRTMKNNSETQGPVWAQKNDKRITKIGRFLRKTRLDELPQIVCVLKGDLSLIGPRPERPAIEVDKLQDINYYYERYNIKPGISGWAQVNYKYGASKEDSIIKLSYDLFYLKNYSFDLDFICFFKTIKSILNLNGT